MKLFSERNPVTVGLIGIGIATVLLVGAVKWQSLPFFDDRVEYSAYFSETGGLASDAPVQVSGVKVGQVSSIELQGDRALVTFEVEQGIPLGERTEAAIKTRTLLGSKVLEITPRGSGTLHDSIPVDRTTPPYELTDALGDLSSAIQGLNTDQLSDSFATLAQTFKDTPPDFQVAVSGVARFSDTLAKRDDELRSLLANAGKATAVLGQRSVQIGSLIADANSLLAAFRAQSGSLDAVSGHLSALARQLSGLVADNRQQLKPALDKLNGTLAIVDKHKAALQKSIKLLDAYAMSLGESVSSGPFFKAYLANLLPGQFVQPFIDAAFSDLGLDPNVLLPSQLTDPQIGQRATPALPVPFPRTGQGGDPRTNLPDAITGNPGDPRYPYRAPQPVPAPGGPPPGPPADAIPAPIEPTPFTAEVTPTVPGPPERGQR